ncbi:hypothetical protein CCACVL1_23044 [Corchorus capsularis]|uniref:Uncharacterized protein n=1 Tax=Corchorus capsularis TaxID=210143 RepID=A0A1R3GVK3_COCAP|nr:hypothetical protein CCACVL1_23044 [Corchorus capsularis]
MEIRAQIGIRHDHGAISGGRDLGG